MSNSERRKGKTGELEVQRIFEAAGFPCSRTPNSGALRIRGDLHGDLPVHVEVKRQETARPWAWWAQATADAPLGVAPVVAMRRSHGPWLALADLGWLIRELAFRRQVSRAIADSPDDAELGRRVRELVQGVEG